MVRPWIAGLILTMVVSGVPTRGDGVTGSVADLNGTDRAPSTATGSSFQRAYDSFLSALRHLDWDHARLRAKEVSKSYGRLPESDRQTGEAKEALAHAEFFLVEAGFVHLQDVVLNLELTPKLPRQLEDTVQIDRDLSERYASVASIGSPEWTVASLVRAAMIPKLIAGELLRLGEEHESDREATCPQCDWLPSPLKGAAWEFNETATMLLREAIAKSFALRVYCDWTLRAEEALAEIDPYLVPPIHTVPLVASDVFYDR